MRVSGSAWESMRGHECQVERMRVRANTSQRERMKVCESNEGQRGRTRVNENRWESVRAHKSLSESA